jgi:hypothetical protein
MVIRRDKPASPEKKTSKSSAVAESGAIDEIDQETAAFFEKLEANRARREQEAAQHRHRLAEEARKEKAEADAALAAELREIERRKREDEEREERAKNAIVAESQARMNELTFDFSWG